MPMCYDCRTVFSGISKLQLHFKHFHKKSETEKYKCGEPNCHATASCWKKFRRHLVSFHHFQTHGTDPPSSSTVHENSDNASVCFTLETNSNTSGDQSSDLNAILPDLAHTCDASLVSASSHVNLNNHLNYHAALLVAKLYSKSGLPRKHVQDFVNDASEFLRSSCASVRDYLNASLTRAQADPSLTSDVNNAIDSLQNPFVGLTSEHQRIMFLKKEGFFIEPVDFTIAYDLCSTKVKDKMLVEMKPVKGKFVPLKDVLQKFLEIPNVFNVISGVLQLEQPEGVKGNFIHGYHWQAKSSKFKGLTIPLYLFYDEYEVDKDLGPHSAKLGAVYSKIACLPPEYQGSLDSIFLVMLFSYEDRKDFGNFRVFKKLVDELNFLYNSGIEFTDPTDGLKKRVYFSMGLFCGDNLGLHMVLGFAEGFTACYPCRFCRVHKSVMHKQCFEDAQLLRDEVQHRNDITTNNVTETGVTSESVLEMIDGFTVTMNPFVDIMHDVFEGGALYDMRHILYSFVYDKNYFDVATLNFRLLTFNYGSEISNRPPQFSEKSVHSKSFRMTASELQTFVRIFAILVGDLVPENDEVWNFYLVLRCIIDIILCKHLQEITLEALTRKVAEHHLLYVKLFDDNLKPKHHYWLHYARIIKLSGSLSNISCDRFEAFHQQSIQNAKATRSRRNIAHTLAVKAQLHFAYRLMNSRGLTTKFEFGVDVKEQLAVRSELIPLSFGSEYSQKSFVNVKGTIYKKYLCIVIGVDEDEGPEFGVVKHVLVNGKGDVCFICTVLICVAFSDHFHAFKVKESKLLRSVLVSDLFDYLPVTFSKACNGNSYVTLHHVL